MQCSSVRGTCVIMSQEFNKEGYTYGLQFCVGVMVAVLESSRCNLGSPGLRRFSLAFLFTSSRTLVASNSSGFSGAGRSGSSIISRSCCCCSYIVEYNSRFSYFLKYYLSLSRLTCVIVNKLVLDIW